MVYLFILREREKESERVSAHGRGRERISSRVRTVCAEPHAGLEPTNWETVT